MGARENKSEISQNYILHMKFDIATNVSGLHSFIIWLQ